MTRACAAVCGFAAFWWDFIVGDDWRIAATVVAAQAATATVATTSVPAWRHGGSYRSAVLSALVYSLWRATRARR